MKGKAMAGGAIGLLVLAAYFLSDLFNGFGLGTGSGTGTGTGDKDSENPPVISSSEEPETSHVNTYGLTGVNLGKMVVVLIDGDEYKVLKSPELGFYNVNNYEDASLQEIVEMAKSVEGSDGVKVRIGMRNNSTATAETKLRNALLDAGLTRIQFREIEDPIP